MRKNTRKSLMILTIISIIGFGAYAFADWGGYGMGGWGHHREGYHMGRGGYGMGGDGYGYRDNLSEEDYKKLDDQMQTFYTETEKLRRKIYEKELALKDELVKESPDAEKATKIQKQLSELDSEFNQKRVEHMIALRKNNPNFNGGYWGEGGRGYMGRGGMTGYGPGGCW